jgi:Transcriptional regulator
MTFRHFEIFVAVCDHSSMTAAAEALAISQPSASQAVRELEEDCGAALFERLGRRLVLTEAGGLCLDYARRMLALRLEMGERVREKGETAALRVGATVTIGSYLLPRILAASKRPVYPIVDNTAGIERRLLEGSLDLGLVEGAVSSPRLARRRFYEDRLAIVCSPRNPAWKSRPTPRELRGRSYYIREEGSGSRELFESAMRRKGLEYGIAGEINNTEALKNFARYDKDRFAVISALALDDTVREVRIAGLALERSFDIVYHKDKAISGALSEFIACVDGFAPR